MKTRGTASEGATQTHMDVVLLGSLYRRPMHGYQLKMELRYKHVDLWAKCHHGHIYYTLKRLERDGHVASAAGAPTAGPPRRTFSITEAGRDHLLGALRRFGATLEDTWFDVDLFLANAWVLPKDEALEVLAARLRAIEGRLAAMRAVQARMTGHMPRVGELMLGHRIAFLEGERRFLAEARAALAEEEAWGSYFGTQDIEDFAAGHGVDIAPPGDRDEEEDAR